VSAPGDFTTALRVGGHAGSFDPAAAAARCAGPRGTAAGASYRAGFSSFGTQYAVEGIFEAVPGGLLQLELVVPASRAPAVRELFNRWLSQLRAAPSHPES
jgi:hypothetical protein